MQSVSENLLLSAGGQQEYMSVLDMMRDPQQSLVIWALEVLVDVHLEQEHNGVDMDEICIILFFFCLNQKKNNWF